MGEKGDTGPPGAAGSPGARGPSGEDGAKGNLVSPCDSVFALLGCHVFTCEEIMLLSLSLCIFRVLLVFLETWELPESRVLM